MPETAVIIGLAALVYLVTNIAKDYEDEETEMNKGLFLLSMIMVIGLEYAGYGIAKANSLSNAADAFLVALLITSIAFIVLLAKLAAFMRDNQKENGKLEGLTSGR